MKLPNERQIATPTHDLGLIRALASDEEKCDIWAVVLKSLRENNMDSDDLRNIIVEELGDNHCFKTEVTKKYHEGTMSDYYSIWVAECSCYMFVKFLISFDGMLVVTSFKKDSRYV